jgi:hypothetical protein
MTCVRLQALTTGSGRQALALLRSHYTALPATHFTATQRILAPHINAHFHSSATHPCRHIFIAQHWWKHPHIFTAQLDTLARHISIAHLWWKRSLRGLLLVSLLVIINLILITHPLTCLYEWLCRNFPKKSVNVYSKIMKVMTNICVD